ncbi:hypothetical protein [Elizabethkingia meningoseptica]|uniref:hypothetical protein n=1 Tax=Elizabethkingia meningoseptica TaxID=238 RepID=UPI0038928639
MNQSMLKQFNNKKTVISFIVLLSLCFCKKHEHIKDNNEVDSIKYKAINQGISLSEERQKEAFGKWRLTNLVYYDEVRGTSNKIKIDEDVTINEQGVLNHENKVIANKYQKVGSYRFKNLDTLNTIYYIFRIGENRMMMKSPGLYRIENGKMTNGRARVEIYFLKNE